MSKCDLYDQDTNSVLDPDQQTNVSDSFNAEAFSDIFPADQISEYEFEQDDSCIYTPPSEGMQLPDFREEAPNATSEAVPEEDFTEIASVISEAACQLDLTEEASDENAYEDNFDSDEEELIDQYEDENEYEALPKLPKKRHHVLHVIGHIILGFLTAFSLLYLVAVYSDNSLIISLRNMYIQTAMSSLNHKYLATAIFPSDMIDDLLRMQYEAENAMVGVESQWGSLNVQSLPSFQNQTTELTGNVDTDQEEEAPSVLIVEEANTTIEYESDDEETFFNIFYEIDYFSMHSYLEEHPDALANGWAYIDINEAGLNDEGTSIKTVHGDQVLAINAQEGIVLVRVNLDLSRGVMAICKDTSQLRLCAASTIGTIGQTMGRICEANNGVLAIAANGFIDPDGEGNGGEISGTAVCNGVTYGECIWGYKRVEIRNDNKMYILDSSTAISSDVRDASEFSPALIIDGDIMVDDNCGWTSPNPRTTIGQTAYLETVMVVVEGRLADSLGCSVVTIAELMQKYGCVQAMNLDGGTSAMMYYDGEYITRCSNTALPSGRAMPNAWVYG